MAKAKQKGGTGNAVLTEETVLPLVSKFMGNMAAIATSMRVSRQAVHKFANGNEAVKEAIAAEKERVKDLIENSLVNRAIAGESWAVCFYLKCQARDRGYIERLDVDATTRGVMVISEEIVDVDPSQDDQVALNSIEVPPQ